MTKYELSIIANRRPETLERLLRVVRHRGFEVVTLQTELLEDQIKLQLQVQSTRAIDLLKNQLAKLYDVVTLN
ncbi:acetolactate synthase small subunit [Bisgaardia hudsonensis]|uniref:Acetolactate synthase small subunit n=1 Tax=Bisgaardia hudsonensis TaxID=109472 RepID=A0A4R2MXT2_9PAST|nr:acetolactate synthase 2 small subunit [Bisgaardia hudsonensis]QLB12260.1 acetolactate synthase [Bisgaardia hudsonensis]TCP12304.1 acetolactate synthase small subunit [Bisgaardia hudsonensis]